MSAEYAPLHEVRKTLRPRWYRCPIPIERLRELSRPSDLQGWFQAGGHLTLFAGTGALVFLFWSRQNWIGFLAALFAHGTIASFFGGVATHELLHGTVFKTRWLHRPFTYIYSLLSWHYPFEYAVSHTYHHRYTLHPDGDREVLLPVPPTVGKTFLLQLFTINLFTKRGRTFGKGGLLPSIIATTRAAFGRVGAFENVDVREEWLKAIYADQPAEVRNTMWFARLTLLFHGSILAYAIATGLWVLPLILTTPAFIGNWLMYFVALPQHCGLRDNVPDFRKCVRSMKLEPVSEFLYWRMNWHAEHHMYAGVPCYNLKKLSREIADQMPEPRTLLGAWREMLGTWKRLQEEPGYQYDTPIPDTAGRRSAETDNALERSIGELAPDGLR
jgi:fatty acid desaturase